MPRHRRPSRQHIHSNKRDQQLADEARWLCEPLLKQALDRLNRLERDGFTKSSKWWRGHYLAEVYAIVVKLMGERKAEDLKRDFYLMVARESNHPEARNLFNLAIQAFETEIEFGISKQRRSDYANALAYAWAHSIPPPLVHGFVLQVGGIKEAAKKYQLRDREEWATADLPWPSLPSSG